MSAEKDYADFPPLVMTFAASDPSGGSGMQADVLTLASMGCHPLTIVTAPRNGTEVVLAWEPSSVPTQVHYAN